MKERKKLKKRVGVHFIIVLVFILILLLMDFILPESNLDNVVDVEKNDISNEINNHYNKYVITNKDAILFDLEHNEVGMIGKGVELVLDDLDITNDSIYFIINNLDNKYFIKYEDVDKIDKITDPDDRYKNYIVFNENIITNDETTFYDEKNNLI